ncbi:SURF1 family protein [Diaphorobacter sp.]|uniref:SURF1 family protein n=1 Tax=Diaphorobacter sp. TaxID=1934310 RepID=UPI003D126F54
MSFARQAWGLRFWLVTLAALLAMAATASLGRWQLQRAAHKTALQATMDERQARAPLQGAELQQALDQAPDAGQLLHRRVLLQGQWLAGATVFLDNRQMNGRPGFFVFTPLRLANGNRVVLVQRGWVPRNFLDRTQLPDVTTPAGTVQLQGRLAGPPARLYEFAPTAPGEGSSRIRQNLDLASYAAQTGLALAPLTVMQTGAASEGLQRDWAPIDSGVDKHYGYAFQWFGLCGLVAILYVWFQFVRRSPPTDCPRDA